MAVWCGSSLIKPHKPNNNYKASDKTNNDQYACNYALNLRQ